jgi:hypothetical protein
MGKFLYILIISNKTDSEENKIVIHKMYNPEIHI